MKKFIIGLVILLVIVAGGWYALKMRSNAPQTIIIDKNMESLLLSDTASSTAPADKVSQPVVTPQADAALKVNAMEIIARPVVNKANLSATELAAITKNIENTNKEIRANYNLDLPWLALSAYRTLLKDYDGAIEALKFLTVIRPKGHVAFHNLGVIYGYELRDYPKSEENFLRSIKNDPTNIDAYSQLATIYKAYAPEKIVPFLQSGIVVNPQNQQLKIMLEEFTK